MPDRWTITATHVDGDTEEYETLNPSEAVDILDALAREVWSWCTCRETQSEPRTRDPRERGQPPWRLGASCATSDAESRGRARRAGRSSSVTATSAATSVRTDGEPD